MRAALIWLWDMKRGLRRLKFRCPDTTVIHLKYAESIASGSMHWQHRKYPSKEAVTCWFSHYFTVKRSILTTYFVLHWGRMYFFKKQRNRGPMVDQLSMDPPLGHYIFVYMSILWFYAPVKFVILLIVNIQLCCIQNHLSKQTHYKQKVIKVSKRKVVILQRS